MDVFPFKLLHRKIHFFQFTVSMKLVTWDHGVTMSDTTNNRVFLT